MQRKNKGFNARAFSLLICVICAFSLWVYVSYVENPDMTRWVKNIPVTVTGESKLNEKGLSIATRLGDDVDLKLRAKRNLFKYLSSDSITATADVSDISRTGENTVTVSLSFPSSASGVTVLERKNMSYTLNVEEYITKTFTVEPDISKMPDDGYFIHSMTVSGTPLKVDISGGKSAINSINKVITDTVDLSKATDTIIKSCSYIPVDFDGNRVENVSLSVTDAEITFAIYKEKNVDVELVYSNNDEGIVSEINPKQITISGPAKIIDDIKVIQTTPINEKSYSSGMKVPLSVPSEVTIHDMDTFEVEITQTIPKVEEGPVESLTQNEVQL